MSKPHCQQHDAWPILSPTTLLLLLTKYRMLCTYVYDPNSLAVQMTVCAQPTHVAACNAAQDITTLCMARPNNEQ